MCLQNCVRGGNLNAVNMGTSPKLNLTAMGTRGLEPENRQREMTLLFFFFLLVISAVTLLGPQRKMATERHLLFQFSYTTW